MVKILGDGDIGVGGIDRFNTETGKREVIRQPDNPDKPFTIDDYNKALGQTNQQNENKIMSDDEKQQVDEGEPVPKNPGGIQIAMRPKLAVNIMRCQFPTDVIVELNEHIDNVIIPNNVDHSKGLVGQIRQN